MHLHMLTGTKTAWQKCMHTGQRFANGSCSAVLEAHRAHNRELPQQEHLHAKYIIECPYLHLPMQTLVHLQVHVYYRCMLASVHVSLSLSLASKKS